MCASSVGPTGHESPSWGPNQVQAKKQRGCQAQFLRRI